MPPPGDINIGTGLTEGDVVALRFRVPRSFDLPGDEVWLPGEEEEDDWALGDI